MFAQGLVLTWTFVSHITFNLVCTTSYHCIICFKKQGINSFFVFVCVLFLFFSKEAECVFLHVFFLKMKQNPNKNAGMTFSLSKQVHMRKFSNFYYNFISINSFIRQEVECLFQHCTGHRFESC